ncbi:MAG: helix-turn-helix domain-containing protein [Bacteroidota bacterium]
MDNYEFDIAFELIENTSRNLFLTGKAGTGKTTFLKYVVQHSKKKMIVVAPTGVAAINAGGVTIHSMFGLPLLSFIPTNDFVDPNIAANRKELTKHFHYSKEKREVFSELELLIIDEISMVRADLLDAVDFALQFIRKNNNPFGGVQTLFIGDMHQLPPVIKDETQVILGKYYSSPYFFDSMVLKNNPPVSIELLKIHRQEDENFIEILNKIRHQKFDKDAFDKLHKRYFPEFELSGNACLPDRQGYIYLTTHNATVAKINETQLRKLKTKSFFYAAEIDGEFKENLFPNDNVIELKAGAQVMFIRNDTSVLKKYFNGKLATVTYLSEDNIKVLFENEKEEYELAKEEWENKQYYVDKENNEIKEDVIGLFSQYPIRLAWAVTIHKSQGLTFDKAIIDAGRSFAPGQVYVALSRCRSLEGIILKSKIHEQLIFSDAAINNFQNEIWNLNEIKTIIESEKLPYSLEKIYKALNLQNLVSYFSAWNEVISEKKIPSKKEVLERCIANRKSLDELSEVENKFVKRLQEMYRHYESKQMTWQQIEDRCSKGIEYFVNFLKENVLFPLELHRNQITNAKKVKGYTKFVKELITEVSAKTEQLKNLYLLEKKLYNIKFEDEPKEIISIKNISQTKEKKASTYEITLSIINEGKTVKEAARERNLTTGTIYSHIAKLISKGSIDATKYLEKNKLEEIISIIEKLEMPALVSIKQKLGSSYTVEEIKLAMGEFFLRNAEITKAGQ